MSGRETRTLRSPLTDGVVNVLLGLVAAVWLLPYLWMLSTSFKTLPEIVRAPTAPLPSGLDLGAYRAVLESMPLARYFWNTTVMALGIAFTQIAVALPAGYALAKRVFAGDLTWLEAGVFNQDDLLAAEVAQGAAQATNAARA